MRLKRKSVSAGERNAYSAGLCRRVSALPQVKAAMSARKTFAVYLASADEIDLGDFIDALHASGCRVAAPAWSKEANTYDLLELSVGSVPVPGPHGIAEPDRAVSRPVPVLEVAVWLVPGLAFSADGGRLGYGGGWYDRFLSSASPDALSFGVAYPFQMVDTLPVEAHDVRLSGVVTAQDAVGFQNKRIAD